MKRTNKELLKTLAVVEPNFKCYMFPTIDYKGEWWLVQDWNDNLTRKVSTPKRIVKLNSFRHQSIEDGQPADFLLNDTLAKSFFDDPIQTLPAHVVAIDNPPIEVPLQVEP